MTWQTEDDDPAGAGLAGLLRLYEAGLTHLDGADRDDLEAQIEHRRALSKKLDLGRRALRIYNEVKFVTPDRRAYLKQLGCAVRSHEIKGAERATVVQIDLHGRPYVLTFREPPASQDEVLAYLDLHCGDGRAVFTVHLTFDITEPGDGWVPGEVESFVPGDWVKDVLELSTRLDRTPEDADVSPADSLRKKFGL